MSLAFRAFFIALFAVIKRWKIVFFFFVFNLLFSLLLVLPLFRSLSEHLGHYSGLQDVLERFAPGPFTDFLGARGVPVESFLLSAGFGGVLYFLLYNILSGGMITLLADHREVTTLKTFFRATGVYGFRFIRLLLYFAMGLVVLGFLNAGLDRVLAWYTEEVQTSGVSARLLGWLGLAKGTIMTILLAYLLIALNYAKTCTVVERRRFMFSSFGSGLAFTFRHPLSTGLFFLLSLVLLGAIFYLYSVLSRWVPPMDQRYVLDSLGGITLSGAILFICVSQAIQFMIQGALIFRHAGQVAIYKYLTVRNTEPDPELTTDTTYPPFIPDRPDTEPGGEDGQTMLEGPQS